MAKQSGIGDQFFIHGVDVSGDTAAVGTIGSRINLLEVTAINSATVERIQAQGDGEMSFQCYFNDNGAANRAAAAGSTFVQLSSQPSTDIVVSWCRGSTLGNVGASLKAIQVTNDVNRGQDGSLLFSAQCMGNASNLDFTKQVTAGKITHSSATNATGYVDTAGTTAGGVGYLQFFSRATGTPTFVIEHSSDTTNGVDGSWSTLLTFDNTGGATALGERKTVAGTVNKGIRARTTGSFTNAVFAIQFNRL